MPISPRFLPPHSQREVIDRRRLLAFTTFGMCIGGGPAYQFFGRFFDTMILPRCRDSKARQAVGLVASDMGGFMPFVYMPIFYSVREFVQCGGDDDASAAAAPGEIEPLASSAKRIVSSAMAKLREGVIDDLMWASLIMVPQDIMVVMYVPRHLKVPFIATTGFLWVLVLSARRGENKSTPASESATAVAAGAKQ